MMLSLVKALFWSFSDGFGLELTCSIQSLGDSDTHTHTKELYMHDFPTLKECILFVQLELETAETCFIFSPVLLC